MESVKLKFVTNMNLKIKPLTKEQIVISVDRLTRFKETETKYLRVFSDIITTNLIEPKFKKHDIENMSYAKLRNLAERVINFSLASMGYEFDGDISINQKLFDYENTVFDINSEVAELLKNKINYKAIVTFISETSPKNLKWFAELARNNNVKLVRENAGLRFPIERVILVEGITEETLLPDFARLCGYDFDKNGVFVISAGGKNQVVKYFYKLVQNCKLPIFVLLDSDAVENLREIQPRLRSIDKIHLLKAGEFEDVLPDALIQRTLEYATQNISLPPAEEFEEKTSRVEYLEEFFRHRGLHEFKKAEFAELVKQNILGIHDVSPEIREIINEVAQVKFS